MPDRPAQPATPPLTTTLPMGWIVGPALVFALAAALVTITDLNTPLFLAWNSAAAQWLPPALWAGITNLGATLGAFCLIAPALAWRPQWVAASLLAAPAAGIFAQGLKRLYAEPRPAAVLDNDSFHIVGLALRTDSFPSGHTTAAFVLAGAVSFCLLARRRPALVVLALAGAALIGFSRIAVGAHWPLDIFTGAAGGWLCGALGYAWSQRWRFWEHPRGVRVMAALLALFAIAFAIEDLGYPEGRWAQYLLAVWALAGAAWAAWAPPRERA